MKMYLNTTCILVMKEEYIYISVKSKHMHRLYMHQLQKHLAEQ